MEEAKPQLRAWWVRYRVILYLLLGLVALDVAVAALSNVWRAYEPDDYLDRVANYRAHPADLVVIGGSPVSEGVDPAPLAGLRWHGQTLEGAYNLGLPGATVLEIWHAVEHGLAQSPPRLLVYGITATDLNDSRLETHGPRSLMDGADLVRMFRCYPRAAGWCARHYARERLIRPWNLFYYRQGIRLWAADHLDRLWPGICPEATREARAGLRYSAAMKCSNGFAPQPTWRRQRLDQMRAAGLLPPFAFLDNYHLGGHLTYLHRLLDWAAARNVAVVLVDMPVSPDLEQRYPTIYASYREALVNLERSRGVRILDARRARVGLTDADFADLIHLNAHGTALLSTWLRRQLAEPAMSAVASNSVTRSDCRAAATAAVHREQAP